MLLPRAHPQPSKQRCGSVECRASRGLGEGGPTSPGRGEERRICRLQYTISPPVSIYTLCTIMSDPSLPRTCLPSPCRTCYHDCLARATRILDDTLEVRPAAACSNGRGSRISAQVKPPCKLDTSFEKVLFHLSKVNLAAMKRISKLAQTVASAQVS